MRAIKYFLNRFGNALRFGAAAFAKPTVFSAVVLDMILKLFTIILTTQESGKHHMTQIAMILPADERQSIATIWVGAGADVSPADRIAELIKENAEKELVLIKCSKALQYNLAKANRKDEPMMMEALHAVWGVVPREECEK